MGWPRFPKVLSHSLLAAPHQAEGVTGRAAHHHVDRRAAGTGSPHHGLASGRARSLQNAQFWGL
jgi:hypothetical protein